MTHKTASLSHSSKASSYQALNEKWKDGVVGDKHYDRKCYIFCYENLLKQDVYSRYVAAERIKSRQELLAQEVLQELDFTWTHEHAMEVLISQQDASEREIVMSQETRSGFTPGEEVASYQIHQTIRTEIQNGRQVIVQKKRAHNAQAGKQGDRNGGRSNDAHSDLRDELEALYHDDHASEDTEMQESEHARTYYYDGDVCFVFES